MEPQKRKIQDDTNSSVENKKTHSELEFSSSEMLAESTLRVDLNNSAEFEKFVDAQTSSMNDEDEEGNDSNLNTIISSVESIDNSKLPSNDRIKSLLEELKKKEEEIALSKREIMSF